MIQYFPTITGSLTVNGDLIVTGTGSMSSSNAVSSSYAFTASSATSAYTASSAVNSFNAISSSYSYTASSAVNSFSASKAMSSSYADTASFANNFTVLGNLTVFGTQSVQYITSSQLNVSDNVITVNVASPGVRFGGLSVFDSGSLSSEATASLFWDSQNNHWIYQRESGSTYNGGMLISGPRNFAGLGNEQGTTSGSLMKGQGGDHVTSSAIFEDGYKATFYTNSLVVSSSGFVGIGTTNPTGSLDVSGSVYIRSSSGGVLYIPRMADQSRGLSIGEQTSLGSKSAVIRTAGGVSEHLFIDPGFNNSDVAGNIALAYANTGSVGIGTYLPSAKLHVVGLTGGASGGATGIPSLGFANSSSIALFTNKDTAYGTLFGTLNTGVGWIQQQRVDGTATAYSLSLQPNGGNVGIGTNSPSQILDLQSAAAVLKMKSTTGINQVYTNYENSAGNFYVGRDSSTAGSFGGSAYAALLYASGPYPMEFWTNSSRKMVITSDGYVAIGNTSPVSRLTVNNAVVGATLPYINGTGLSYNSEGISVAGSNTNNTNIGNGLTLFNNVASVGAYSPVIAFSSMTPGGAYNATYAFITGIYQGSGGDSNWAIGDLMFGTGNAYGAEERMRIRRDGVVLVGTTTTSLSNAGTQLVPNGETYHSIVNSLNTLHVYDRTNSVYRFYVGGNGTVNATNTTISAISDVRLKENIVDLEIGLDAIMSLRPRQFDWKKESGNSGKNIRGFIAQEFEQIFPDLIDESINPVPEGEEPYKQIRQDLIPILVKAIQELKAEFDTYKETHP